MTADGHTGGRPSGVSAVMSHYLGELYRLGGFETVVTPSELAEVMEVTPPAAARMIERLEEKELVERIPYQGVRLTQTGAQEALREIRYHRLSEAFLVRVMEYGWHEAHDMADALAEVADEEFVRRMDEKAGFPTRCPHGEPIPTADGEMPIVEDVPLTELPVGASGVISRVKVREEDKLVYLAEVGIVPEEGFEIVGKAPFGGPVRLAIGRGEQTLGSELAGNVRVQVEQVDGQS